LTTLLETASVSIVATAVPAKDAPAISYPMAVATESRQPKAAKAFLEHLKTDEAGKVFEKYGFVLRK